MRIIRRIIVFMCCLLSAPFIQAQTLTAHRGTVPGAYDFWVSTPADYDPAEAVKPVILFLHGNSLCGHDLQRVRRYGPLHAQAMGRQIDAVIVAPQNPGGAWNSDKIKAVLDWSLEHYPGDTNRIYVIGMSLGGYGTINFVGTYPERIAAAMALCGGGGLKSYCGLTTLPFWILHGTADRAVGLSQSQKVVSAMAACGDTSLLRFTKLKGAGHAHLAKAFYIPETYEWLFAHSRADSVRRVNRSIRVDMPQLAKAYSNIDRNANKLVVKNYASAPGDTGVLPDSADAANAGLADASSQASASPKYHTIRQGDTLGALARKYHTSVAALCRLNHIKETTLLQIGRKLRVR